MFAVSRDSLPIPGIRVRRLLKSGSQAHADHGHRIECAPCSERELLFGSERGSVINKTGIEVWEEADQTLLFFHSYLLSARRRSSRRDGRSISMHQADVGAGNGGSAYV
jgi:hypothetical protein